MSTLAYMRSGALTDALIAIQRICLGVFRPYALMNDPKAWQLIIAIDGDQLTVVSIGTLFGLSEDHTSAAYGTVVLFPDDKTLWEMMNDPSGLHHWWQQYCE